MSESQIVPDDKDWTFVITDGCTECGFRPGDPHQTGAGLRNSIPRWQTALARPDADRRPNPATWSTLEYGCHVRDVCRVFSERLNLMLASTDPEGARFQNWDQDVAAIDGDYASADAGQVSAEYALAASALADQWDAVADSQRTRRGLRSNGSAFTVDTLAIYFLHDIGHHLHDVDA